jgi:hypothetical protein
MKLVERLEQLYYDIDHEDRTKFRAIIYFDEAHTLKSASYSDGISCYASFLRVIDLISDIPISFVFISTQLDCFMPRISHHENTFSRTDFSGSNQPIVLMPFDCFCRNFISEAKAADKLTLAGVCEVGQLAKFGRPM